MVVDRKGDDFLAGAIFASNQIIRIASGNSINDVQQLQHRRAVTDDLWKLATPMSFRSYSASGSGGALG